MDETASPPPSPGGSDPPSRPPKRRRPARALTLLVGLAVVAGIYAFALPRIADYRDVWQVVSGLAWPGLVALAAATVVNVVTFAPPWMVALPGLGFRRALAVTQASTASTYVAPGGAAPGMAVSFAILRGWGFGRRAVTLAVALTGVWNQLVIFGFPPVALLLLALTGASHPLLQTFATIGLFVVVALAAGLAAAFASEGVARRVGDAAARLASSVLRLAGRRAVAWGGASLVRFRADTIVLLRRRWHLLTVATLAGHLSVFVVLVVCLRAVGASDDQVSGVEVFAAWSIVRLVGSLPITPGGLGIVELSLTSLLVGFGSGQAEAVAATLLYRFLTVIPTLLLGLAAAATWRRHGAAGKAAVD